MKTKIELIYFTGCPNVDKAREVIRLALERAGEPPEWVEWNREDPAAPSYVQGFGSPTILVNGRDVAGESAGAAASSCRVYPSGEAGFRGVPAVEAILLALPPGGPRRLCREGRE